MMKKTTYFFLYIVFVALISGSFLKSCSSSKKVDASLFLRKDSIQVKEVISDEADIYKEIGHHGPAIENEYYALRLYFNNSGAIDVYNKSKKQLELEKTLWYPTPEMQAEGYGSDQYKVGETVGLGGIKLWDGEKIVDLIATKGREARIFKLGNTAKMELLAKGVEYKNEWVDIKLTVSIESGNRLATVNSKCTSGQKVQFVTGINFHEGNEVKQKNGYILVWGKHPEDVALNPGAIGSAFIFDEHLFDESIKEQNQWVFISFPTNKLQTMVTTVSEHEPEFGSVGSFNAYLNSVVK